MPALDRVTFFWLLTHHSLDETPLKTVLQFIPDETPDHVPLSTHPGCFDKKPPPEYFLATIAAKKKRGNMKIMKVMNFMSFFIVGLEQE